jgi:hypothetical protein
LPTFVAGGRGFYERLTLIAARRRIIKTFNPVVAPEEIASKVVGWLAHQR